MNPNNLPLFLLILFFSHYAYSPLGRYFIHIEHPDGVIKRQIKIE